MDTFLIKTFNDILYIRDPGGKQTVYTNRCSSCFIMTLQGRIRFTFKDDIIETSASQGIFIPKGANYVNSCLEDAESIQINLDTVLPLTAPRRLRTPDRKTAMLAYENIRRHTLTGSPQDHFYILGELYLLAHHLFQEDSASPLQDLAETAFRYLKSEFSRPDLQIEAVARYCNVSSVYLRKVFAQFYGKSPFAMLTELRMAKAHVLLLEKRPVKEIALAVGYSDIYQFSRAYKRYFGSAPTKTKTVEKHIRVQSRGSDGESQPEPSFAALHNHEHNP